MKSEEHIKKECFCVMRQSTLDEFFAQCAQSTIAQKVKTIRQAPRLFTEKSIFHRIIYRKYIKNYKIICLRSNAKCKMSWHEFMMTAKNLQIPENKKFFIISTQKNHKFFDVHPKIVHAYDMNAVGLGIQKQYPIFTCSSYLLLQRRVKQIKRRHGHESRQNKWRQQFQLANYVRCLRSPTKHEHSMHLQKIFLSKLMKHDSKNKVVLEPFPDYVMTSEQKKLWSDKNNLFGYEGNHVFPTQVICGRKGIGKKQYVSHLIFNTIYEKWKTCIEAKNYAQIANDVHVEFIPSTSNQKNHVESFLRNMAPIFFREENKKKTLTFPNVNEKLHVRVVTLSLLEDMDQLNLLFDYRKSFMNQQNPTHCIYTFLLIDIDDMHGEKSIIKNIPTFRGFRNTRYNYSEMGSFDALMDYVESKLREIQVIFAKNLVQQKIFQNNNIKSTSFGMDIQSIIRMKEPTQEDRNHIILFEVNKFIHETQQSAFPTFAHAQQEIGLFRNGFLEEHWPNFCERNNQDLDKQCHNMSNLKLYLRMELKMFLRTFKTPKNNNNSMNGMHDANKSLPEAVKPIQWFVHGIEFLPQSSAFKFSNNHFEEKNEKYVQCLGDNWVSEDIEFAFHIQYHFAYTSRISRNDLKVMSRKLECLSFLDNYFSFFNQIQCAHQAQPFTIFPESTDINASITSSSLSNNNHCYLQKKSNDDDDGMSEDNHGMFDSIFWNQNCFIVPSTMLSWGQVSMNHRIHFSARHEVRQKKKTKEPVFNIRFTTLKQNFASKPKTSLFASSLITQGILFTNRTSSLSQMIHPIIIPFIHKHCPKIMNGLVSLPSSSSLHEPKKHKINKKRKNL